MYKNLFILRLIAIILLGAVFQQGFGQKWVMKIANITAAAGEEAKALELKTAVTPGSTVGSGGSFPKPFVESLLIKKVTGRSTNHLLEKFANQDFIPKVVMEYYDKDNVLTYLFEFSDVLIYKVDWLSPECPNCLPLDILIGLSPKIVLFEDKKNNLKRTWSLVTGSAN
jgi:hypothetical protein